MRQEVEIVYTVDVLEFAIAVNLCGGKTVMAPGNIREDADAEDVLMALSQMVNKQMIMINGTSFVLCEPYRELFSGIVNAFDIVEISVKDYKRESLCCYIKDAIWCVTQDVLNSRKVKCRRIEDLAVYLEENEYLPLSLEESPVETWEALLAEEKNVMAEVMSETDNLLEAIYRCERSGQEVGRIGISESVSGMVLWMSENGHCYVMDYSFEKLHFLLKRMQRKEHHGIS